MAFTDFHSAAAAWEAPSQRPCSEARGVYLPDAKAFAWDEAKVNYMAMDAQPVAVHHGERWYSGVSDHAY